MMQGSAENAYKLRALKLSTIAIATVVTVEVVIGFAVGSLAILSDGLHALLDTITTLTLFVATRASLKPPDAEHMYGHEKFEAIGGLVGGVSLIGVALLIIYEAVSKLLQNRGINQGLELVGFVAIGYTFCIDFFRVGTFSRARKSESATVKAGFYHAIADLSSTVVALVGFGLATLGFYGGDSLASIILGVLLSYLSIGLVRSSITELSDSISKDMAQKIRKEMLSVEGALRCDNLRIRRAGSKTFVDATMQVPNYMSLKEAHALASKVEANLKKTVGNIDATIHIEPSEKETTMKQLVEGLTTDVKGVREVHDIATIYAGGKLYVTLHAYVDPKLSIQEAHRIAEEIENKVRGQMREVENVTVHIEPLDEAYRGSESDESEMIKRIHEVADGGRDFQIRRIVTYVADEKRYINVDCGFSRQISIKEAHRIASEIERKIKELFPETIVTAHIEPDSVSKEMVSAKKREQKAS